MQMSIEAMKQALEALERLFGIPEQFTGKGGGDVAVWRLGGSYRAQQAIPVLRQAIAQAEKQEPVALQMDVIVVNLVREGINKHRARELAEHFIKHTTPQPQREWVGLTDEEMRELEKQFNAERVRTSDEEYLVIYPGDYWQWQRAIEAKLKEKNT
jgi:hypothetical protein